MNKEDIAAAKARCAAALDAPWEVQPRQELAAAGNFFTRWDIVTAQKRLVAKGIYGEADADFIAHARSDLPAALEALEEAQGKLDAVLKWIGGCSCKHCPEIRRILSKEGEYKGVPNTAKLARILRRGNDG